MKTLMNRLLKVAALMGFLVVGGSPAFAMICGGGFSQTESNHTTGEHACFEYYFNNSGAALTSGSVVIWDTSGTGVNASTESSASRADVDNDPSDGDVDNIGTYITTTTTADDELVAGVVDDDSCANQSYCRVQVRGPRLVRCLDSSDAVGIGTSVGTSTTAGQCGDQANQGDGSLGVALQAGSGFDGPPIWIWIRPGNAD